MEPRLMRNGGDVLVRRDYDLGRFHANYLRSVRAAAAAGLKSDRKRLRGVPSSGRPGGREPGRRPPQKRVCAGLELRVSIIRTAGRPGGRRPGTRPAPICPARSGSAPVSARARATWREGGLRPRLPLDMHAYMLAYRERGRGREEER